MQMENKKNDELGVFSLRTDLALEAAEMIKNRKASAMAEAGELPEGMQVVNGGNEDIRTTQIIVTTDEASQAIGKPKGNYTTLEMPNFHEFGLDEYRNTSKLLADELKKIITDDLKDKTILIVGLGNWNITADSLGPKVVSKLMVSRHMKQYFPDDTDERLSSVCAISPGVLGITGIETAEIITGLVEKVKPDLVIAIDALASRKISRVNTTIQVADSGIAPGSGVGNKRKELSKNTLGVSVIAIGVPTVVDAATFTSDTIDMVTDKMNSSFLKDMDENRRFELIRNMLDPNVAGLIVTPKDIDDVMNKLSGVISDGINLALHNNISIEEFHEMML